MAPLRAAARSVKGEGIGLAGRANGPRSAAAEAAALGDGGGAVGATEQAGFVRTQPKPVFISSGPSLRRDQSLICTRSAIWGRPEGAPMGTAVVMQPNSPSKSIPSSSDGIGTSAVGP